jgi:hypothetical protein
LALGVTKPKPLVFLSFAGEDVEWKRTLMQGKWWASLTKVAGIYDYDDKPLRDGGLDASMIAQINASSAFIALLSKYYIGKNGVVESEFRQAVDRYKEPARQHLFRAIVIDAEAKEWWDGGGNALFAQHDWLRKKIYWPLIEDGQPALLNGDLQPRYSRDVRDYAEAFAKAIVASPAIETGVKPTEQKKIIILGRPNSDASSDAATNSGIAVACDELLAQLRNRRADVSDWGNGWARARGEQQDVCVRELLGPVGAIVRPLAPSEAFDAAVSPEITLNQLQFLAGAKAAPADIRKIKTSLWLPFEHRDHPDAKIFVDKVGSQTPDTNPLLCVAAVSELVDRLVPRAADKTIAQISVEALDDVEPIEADGPTARKIVEEELRAFVRKGAERAKIELGQPLIRQFLNYRRLANQITEAKNGRTMLVAHDLQEHIAGNNADAHRILGNKVRNLKESVESMIALSRGQIIPLILIVTNYEYLQNDIVLDEEIAGAKWWLLPGRVSHGRFSAEQDVYDHITESISRMFLG